MAIALHGFLFIAMLSTAAGATPRSIRRHQLALRNHSSVRMNMSSNATGRKHVSVDSQLKLDANNATQLSKETLTMLKELELPDDPSTFRQKSKVDLALITALGLGFCGIDRCFLGQVNVGWVKCLTCGGCGIWFLVDFLLITINMLQKAPYIDQLGLQAQFVLQSDIVNAYWITLISLILQCFCGCCAQVGQRSQASTET